jgi:ABC-type amino acid transport substrate-binding protein
MMRPAVLPRLRVACVAALLLTAAMVVGEAASAGTPDRITLDKTIRLAYREDAPPFSYKDKSGEPAGYNADVISVKTHGEGLAMLDDGKITAYFADRSVLESLIKDSETPDQLIIAQNYLTIEPYALALPRGDDDVRPI